MLVLYFRRQAVSLLVGSSSCVCFHCEGTCPVLSPQLCPSGQNAASRLRIFQAVCFHDLHFICQHTQLRAIYPGCKSFTSSIQQKYWQVFPRPLVLSKIKPCRLGTRGPAFRLSHLCHSPAAQARGVWVLLCLCFNIDPPLYQCP